MKKLKIKRFPKISRRRRTKRDEDSPDSGRKSKVLVKILFSGENKPAIVDFFSLLTNQESLAICFHEMEVIVETEYYKFILWSAGENIFSSQYLQYHTPEAVIYFLSDEKSEDHTKSMEGVIRMVSLSSGLNLPFIPVLFHKDYQEDDLQHNLIFDEETIHELRGIPEHFKGMKDHVETHENDPDELDPEVRPKEDQDQGQCQGHLEPEQASNNEAKITSFNFDQSISGEENESTILDAMEGCDVCDGQDPGSFPRSLLPDGHLPSVRIKSGIQLWNIILSGNY